MQGNFDEELLIQTLRNQIRKASKELNQLNLGLQKKIPSQEQISNYEQVEKELLLLISEQSAFYVEKINQLSMLSLEKINELDSEQSANILENFHSINILTSKIWELFKYTDINPSEQRILQLIENNSKDILRPKLEELQKLNSETNFSFFDFGPEKKKRLEKLKNYADIYLAYHNNKEKFQENLEIVINHTSELINKQSSLGCTQQ